MTLARQFLDEALLQLRKLKAQADKAMAQVNDRAFFDTLDPDANSIALIVKHLAGNMRSRWTDFLTSDGEKPDRERDNEFLVLGDTRESLMAAWEDGWRLVFDAVSALSDQDVTTTVRIRGEAHTVLQAIDRQLTHYAGHVGQIVLLAKHHAGANWHTLSIPRGKSNEFEAAKVGSPHGGPKEATERTRRSEDDAEWEDFLSFLATAPAVRGPQEMFNLYGSALAGRGLSRPDAQRRVAALFARMRECSDAWPLMFDRIYASTSPNVIAEPSPLLTAAVEGVAPGRALDIAVGHGRNAVALASLGWDVTGIDVSEEGLAAARASAERAGVRLTLARAQDEDFDFGESAWDLVAVIYGPVSITNASYAQRLGRALRPGGLVVIESFASDTASQRRRPVDIDPTELRHAFDAFRFLRFEDVEGVSEWDPQPTRLVRMVARKG